MTKSTQPPASILEALDIANLEPKEQEDLLVDLNDLIYKGTMVRLIERMDERTRDEFNTLLDSEAPEDQIEAFIQDKVPNADEAVNETIAELTSDILAVTSQ